MLIKRLNKQRFVHEIGLRKPEVYENLYRHIYVTRRITACGISTMASTTTVVITDDEDADKAEGGSRCICSSEDDQATKEPDPMMNNMQLRVWRTLNASNLLDNRTCFFRRPTACCHSSARFANGYAYNELRPFDNGSMRTTACFKEQRAIAR